MPTKPGVNTKLQTALRQINKYSNDYGGKYQEEGAKKVELEAIGPDGLHGFCPLTWCLIFGTRLHDILGMAEKIQTVFKRGKKNLAS